MVLQAVFRNSVDEMSVDLDVVGVDFRPHAQIGEAFAQIVDGDLVAEAAQLRDRLVDAGEVVDVLVLCNFDDHPIRIQAQLGEQVSRAAVEKTFILKAVGAGIDEQFSRQMQSGEIPEYRFPTGSFEHPACSQSVRGCEKRLRGMERRIFRPAD